jgi:hypothetical protein
VAPENISGLIDPTVNRYNFKDRILKSIEEHRYLPSIVMFVLVQTD